MRSVTCDNADKSVNGSNEVTVWLRFNASRDMLSTAMWSAMKKASNLPRLERLRKAFEVRKVKIGVRESAGIPPGMQPVAVGVLLHPHEGHGLEGEAPRLNHVERVRQARPRRPEKQSCIVAGELRDHVPQRLDFVERAQPVMVVGARPDAAGRTEALPWPRRVGIDDREALARFR